jgi:hypothetical protein
MKRMKRMNKMNKVFYTAVAAAVLIAASVVTVTFFAGCSNPSGSSPGGGQADNTGDTNNTGNPGDTGNTNDTDNTGDTGDTGNTNGTNNTNDTNNTENTGNTDNTDNTNNTVNTVEIGIGIGGNLVVTGGGENNVIYRDREPSRLELKVSGEGWESLDWHVDGRSEAAWKGQAAVIVYAEDLTEARHSVTLTGAYRGGSYSTVIPLTVTRDRPAVTWTETVKNSSRTDFDLFAWKDDGPTETWSLSVTEQSVVYFAVRKPPNAVITVQNTTGAVINKASPGETVDGSFADDILDLFTVRLGEDAAFGAEECRFDLAVTEPGKQPKTVNVRTATRPNLTGAAIFHRGADGTLARITAENEKDHANSLYAQHKAGIIPDWGIDIVNVINLSTALKWLDNYAQSGTGKDQMAEYLVRVEADEVMPKILLTCRLNSSTGILAEYVKIRIRGYGGERTITHDPSNNENAYVYKGTSSIIANHGFLNIGPQTGSNYKLNYLAVHLEQDITIDAAGGNNPHFPYRKTDPFIVAMIDVGLGNTLVMETGSKLTNYVYISTYDPNNSQNYPAFYDQTAVYIREGGVFEWRGGEISKIQGEGAPVQEGNIVLCAPAYNDIPAGAFYYYGKGVMYGNRKDQIAVGNYSGPAFYAVTDPRFAP